MHALRLVLFGFVSLILVLAAAILLLGCPAPRPQPTPTPEPEPTATPVPEPAPSECPAFDPAKLRLPCKPHAERGDGQTVWDCTVYVGGARYMAEGDPNALICELKAMQGRPNYLIVSATDSLELLPRSNPFQFNLKGTGYGWLMCPVDGVDPCRKQPVSR